MSLSPSSDNAAREHERPNIPRRLFRQHIDPEAAHQLASEDLYSLRRFIHGHAAGLALRDHLARTIEHLDLNRLPGPELEKLGSNLRRFCGVGRVDVAESLLLLRFGEVNNAQYLLGPKDPDPELRKTAAELGDPNYLPRGPEKWQVFYMPRVEVWYTTNTEDPVLARHALTGQGAAFSEEAGIRGYVLNRDTPQEIRLGRISNRLEDLNSGLEGVENIHVPPARVQRIGLLAERAINVFGGPLFSLRDPVPGGGRLRVRVCDVTDGGRRYPGATHPKWDHIRINGAFLSSELIGTVPHEVFHRVQYRYNDTADDTGIQRALREGGARFAEDCFNDAPNRYLAEATPIFAEPWRSLASSRNPAETPYDYEAGLFWKYLAEQHGTTTKEPTRGVDLYRAVLECTATRDSKGDPLPRPEAEQDPSGYDVRMLRAAFSGKVWYGHFDRFLYLDEARLEVLSQETTWGNWLVANYLRGTLAAGRDGRFRYREDEVVQDSQSHLWTTKLLRARVRSGDARELSAGVEIDFGRDEHEPPAWGGARYYRILIPHGAPRSLVEITLTTKESRADPLTQILMLDQEGGLRDLIRSDSPEMRRTISTEGLSEIAVVVANRERPGRHSLAVRAVPSGPLVGATRWNCRAGASYEVDPAGWSWTWLSPDMTVEGDTGQPGSAQMLKLRLRNKGNAVARGVTVTFWYQPASEALHEKGWLHVQDAEGRNLTAECADLRPGAEAWVAVPWCPLGQSVPLGWIIKAKITTPGDPDGEGKIVLGGVCGAWSHAETSGTGLAETQTRSRQGLETRLLARRPGWRCGCGSPRVAEVDARATLARARRLAVSDGIIRPILTSGSLGLELFPCDDLHEWDGEGRGDAPEGDRWYPPHPETLPPQLVGGKANGLATVVTIVDGLAVFGATFLVPTIAPNAEPNVAEESSA